MTVPSTLYKYTPASTADLILKNGRLRWSSPVLFDDPAEFKRMPGFEPSLTAAAAIYPQTLVKHALGELIIDENRLIPNSALLLNLIRNLIANGFPKEQLLETLDLQGDNPDSRANEALSTFTDQNLIGDTRVICLTTDQFNAAMWSAYSEGHTGCVLGFRHIKERDTPFLAAQKVTYSDTPPNLGPGLDFLLYGHSKELRARSIDAICFTKRSEWSYQREWRVVDWPRGAEHGGFNDYKFYPEELESITFGFKCARSTREQIASLVRDKYQDCSLYEINYDRGEMVHSPFSE